MLREAIKKKVTGQSWNAEGGQDAFFSGTIDEIGTVNISSNITVLTEEVKADQAQSYADVYAIAGGDTNAND